MIKFIHSFLIFSIFIFTSKSSIFKNLSFNSSIHSVPTSFKLKFQSLQNQQQTKKNPSMKKAQFLYNTKIYNQLHKEQQSFESIHLKKEQSLLQSSKISIISNSTNIRILQANVQYNRLLLLNIILTICWFIFADLGIFFKWMPSIPHNYTYHIVLFIMVTITSLTTLIILLIFTYRIENLLYYNIVAILLIFLLLTEFIIGIIKRFLQKITTLYPGYIIVLSKPHRYIGYFLMLFFKIFVLIGWYILHQVIISSVLAVQTIIIFTCFIIYRFYILQNISQKLFFKITLDDPIFHKTNIVSPYQKYDQIRKYPYNDQQFLKQYNFFIFNDEIYQYQTLQFHPGGAKILELTKRRQIDRFIYGMYHLEIYPNLIRFDHPQNAFNLLKKPIYRLPKNPLYQITNQNFIVHKKIDITPTLSVFYLKQQIGQIVFTQQYNMWSFGQYFTLKGFGMTRMFVCVKSQRRRQRERAKKLLQMAIIALNQNKYITPYQYYKTKQDAGEFIHNTHQQILELQKTNMITFHKIKKQDGIQDIAGDDAVVCVVIKKYDVPHGFSKQIHQNYKQCKIKVSGLTGRGMCLDKVKRGTVVIVVGGAIFPFLDLFDMIFKILLSDRIPLNPILLKQIAIYKQLLKGFKFIFFGAFQNYKLSVIPQQLVYMHNCKDPIFKMGIKLTKTHQIFKDCLVHGRFNGQFFKKQIKQIQDLSIIYNVGPPSMGKDLAQGVKQIGLPFSKIFFI